jgi:thiaminase
MKKLLEKRTKELSKLLKSINLNKKEVYGQWLGQTYYYVDHSVKLLALSVACMHKDESLKNKQRFIGHMKEENNHELIAKKDISNLGLSIEDISELPETAMFYESQYLDPSLIYLFLQLIRDYSLPSYDL